MRQSSAYVRASVETVTGMFLHEQQTHTCDLEDDAFALSGRAPGATGGLRGLTLWSASAAPSTWGTAKLSDVNSSVVLDWRLHALQITMDCNCPVNIGAVVRDASSWMGSRCVATEQSHPVICVRLGLALQATQAVQ